MMNKFAHPFPLLFLLSLAALLWGCAATPVGTNSSGGQISKTGDVVTDSDEPENRKRARLRLELASGYFEQGQTTVALDEIKQSLANDPSYGEAFNLRGLIYMRLNDPGLAEDSFKRALALNPRDANTAHNYGWLTCQQRRYAESEAWFAQVMSNATYGRRAQTLMTQGVCQMAAGENAKAERSFARSYELDATNPIAGYNLSSLLYQRGDFSRAQFYIRRLNNSDLANSESLWLGIKVERSIGDRVAMLQLAEQLKKRFPRSKELLSYDRGRFDE